MNVQPRQVMRALTIAALLVVGMATTISSGGGGGGGGSGGTATQPSDLVAIDGNNAHDVSSALIFAVVESFDIGDFAGGEIMGLSVAGSTRVQKLLLKDSMTASFSAATALDPQDCVNGGTATVTATLADPNTLTVGDQISAVFENCDEGDGYILDGQMDLTVAAIEGDIMTDVFLLGLDMIMTDMSVTEGTETIVINADATLTLDTLGFPVVVETLEGAELSFTMGPEVLTFTNFEHVFQVDSGVFPGAVLVTVNGRMDSVDLGGAIDYATTLAIEAFGDNDPHIGQILIAGDNSSVRIVINDSTSVTLEVDTNGDGVIDEYIETTFAALSGDISSINDSNALAVAQAVTHASKGFGLMVSLPGPQFFENQPFGQVQQLGLSGDIGPLELSCGDTGTVVVSGFVAAAGTFTADDSLSAAYSGCGGNLWTGQLDIVVSSFAQEADDWEGLTDPFHFIGTATVTSFESVASNSTYLASGSLEIDFNYQVEPIGSVSNGFSPSFSIAHGSVRSTLSDASASVVMQMTELSRLYEGRLTSDRFVGDYSYQSISPYLFLSGIYPGNFSESPSAGELLITAEDGSTLRIVVIDELTIRLDIDYEGDSVVDFEIGTTWDELL